LAGGEHFYSLQILGMPLGEHTANDIEKEKKKFKAMCFLLKADENRYARLLDDSKKVYKWRNEYPTTVSDAYELLIRTSRQLSYNPRRSRNHNMNPQQCLNNFMFA